ncbi:ABC transporter ATP-binding protein [bacterium]|nr:ABC transporter ATP-binding protein [bacterium]
MWWRFSESEEGVRAQSLRELLPKVLPLIRPHRRLLFGALVLLPLVTCAQLSAPLILQYIIDQCIKTGAVDKLWYAAGLYLAIVSAGLGLGYLQAMTLFRLGIGIISQLKVRLFEHVLRLGLDFHEQHSPGKLISRVESDTETLREMFGDVTVNLIRNLMLLVGIFIVLAVKNLTIAAWVMLLVPLLFGATFFYLSRMKKMWREMRARVAMVTGYVTEYVQGVEVIQQFNYEQRARERMADVNRKKFSIDVPTQMTEYGFWGLFMMGEVLAIIIVLAIGVEGVFAGTLTVGTLILFIEYIRKLFEPIMQLSEQLNFVQRGMVSVERIFGILETKPSVQDGPRPEAELRFEHEIRFENVWFAYKDSREKPDNADAPDAAAAEPEWILRDVSFSLPKGQSLALVGSSGGGKTTIVSLLLRFYDPQRGRITVDGQDIRDFPVQAWRARIGLVLQDIYLFPGSVGQNLRVFNPAISDERALEAARTARADTIIERLPGGLEGELSERGANLSVGERQLISFARALSFNPPLLVLDEATSSVDPQTERMVQEALERLLAGRTAVIVAHRLSTITGADQILVMSKGRVAERGRHQELLEQGGLYAKLCRLQFGDASAPLPAGAKYIDECEDLTEVALLESESAVDSIPATEVAR